MIDNNSEELNKYIAHQYNLMDHLTRTVYGEGIRYEQLSPFGQKHIESLAMLQPSSASPDPDILRVREENALLREENANLMERISSLLLDVEDLWYNLEEQEDRE
jgi:hypothetical protein